MASMSLLGVAPWLLPPLTAAPFSRRPTWTTLSKRLGLLDELKGHTGCVNRLAWDHAGSALASVSDDTKLIIWSMGRDSSAAADPARVMHRAHRISTGHTNNIFGVAWSPPYAGPTRLVTGAADSTVRLHTAEGDHWRSELLGRFGDRVKSVVTPRAGAGDSLAWAAIENGAIVQFDFRTASPSLSAAGGRSDVPPLIQVRNPWNTPVETKGVAVSPANEHHLAVACDDGRVRLYDRRLLPVVIPRNADGQPARSNNVLEYAPLHTAWRMPGAGDNAHSAPLHRHLVRSRELQAGVNLAVTHCEFDETGRSLLGAFGSEGVYEFDVLVNDVGAAVEGGDAGGLSWRDNDGVVGGSGSNAELCVSGAAVDSAAAAAGPAEAASPDLSSAADLAVHRAVDAIALALLSQSTAAAAAATAALPHVPRISTTESYVDALARAMLMHKEAGNFAFRSGRWDDAVDEYCTGLEAAAVASSLLQGSCNDQRQRDVTSSAAMLQANLASARLKRGVPGDASGAVLAAVTSTLLEPSYWKAHARLVRALLECDAYDAGREVALRVLEQLRLAREPALTAAAVKSVDAAATAAEGGGDTSAATTGTAAAAAPAISFAAVAAAAASSHAFELNAAESEIRRLLVELRQKCEQYGGEGPLSGASTAATAPPQAPPSITVTSGVSASATLPNSIVDGGLGNVNGSATVAAAAAAVPSSDSRSELGRLLNPGVGYPLSCPARGGLSAAPTARSSATNASNSATTVTGSSSMRYYAGIGTATAASTAAPEVGPLFCYRHVTHYFGARNCHTDIKEAAYWGGAGDSAVFGATLRASVAAATAASSRSLDGRRDGNDGTAKSRADETAASWCWGRKGFIVAGCDTGEMLLFDRASGSLIGAINADWHTCNAVRPHPVLPWLATSGIDSSVKLWGPMERLDDDEVGGDAPPPVPSGDDIDDDNNTQRRRRRLLADTNSTDTSFRNRTLCTRRDTLHALVHLPHNAEQRPRPLGRGPSDAGDVDMSSLAEALGHPERGCQTQ